MVDIARLGIEVDTRQLSRGEASLRQFAAQGDRTGRQVAGASDRINTSTRRASSSVGALGLNYAAFTAIAAAGTVLTLGRQFLQVADNVDLLQARVARFTSTQEDAERLFNRLTDASRRTGSGLDVVIGSFTRFAPIREQLGATNEQLVSFTETLVNLGRLGGSGPEEIRRALVQLSQGFSAGIIRAEEYNSVVENAPEIIRAYADTVDQEIGDVRATLLRGELDARSFFEGIQGSAERVNEEIANLPRTVDQASSSFGTAFSRIIDQLDDTTGASSSISRELDNASDSLAVFGGNIGSIEELNRILGVTQARLAESRVRGDSVRQVIQRASLDASGILQNQIRLIGEQIIALEAQNAAQKAVAGSQPVPIPPRVAAAITALNQEHRTLIALSGQSSREQEILTAQLKAGAVAGTDTALAIRRTAGAIFDLQQAQLDTTAQEKQAEANQQVLNGLRVRVIQSVSTREEALNLEAAQRLGIAATQDEIDEFVALSLGLDQVAKNKREASEAASALIRAQREAERATQQEERALEQLRRQLDPTTAAWNDYFDALILIESAGLSIAESTTLENNAFIQLGQNLTKISEQSTTIEDAWRTVDGAVSGVVRGIVNNSDNAFDAILDSFKNLLVNLASEAISSQIQLQFSSTATSTAGSAAAGTAGSSAGAAGGAIGAGGIYGLIAVAAIAAVSIYNDEQSDRIEQQTAAFRQANQSTGTLLGIANAKSESIRNSISEIESTNIAGLDVSNSMLQRLYEIRDGIRTAATGVSSFVSSGGDVQGLGVTQTDISGGLRQGAISAGGSVANIAGLGGKVGGVLEGLFTAVSDKIAKAVSSKKVTVSDQGIEFLGQGLSDLMDGALLEASGYIDVRSRRKVFGLTVSDKITRDLEDLDESTAAQFAQVFSSAGAILEEASLTFGLDFGSRVNELMVEAQSLSLKDLEGDELIAEIEAFFSSTLDNWASVLTDGSDVLARFQEVGEGAFEAMVRLSAQTESFMAVASAAGLDFNLTGEDAIVATQQIASDSGGFDRLASNLNSYAASFIDDSRLIEIVSENLGEQFRELGETLPRTRDQFSELIREQDLSTEAGRRQVAQLLSLTSATDQYITALERQISGLAAASDQALVVLRQAVEAGTVSRTEQFEAANDAIDTDFNQRIAEIQESSARLTSSFTAQLNSANGGIRNLTTLANALRQAAQASIVQTRDLTLARRRAAQGVLSNAISTGNLAGVQEAATVVSQPTEGLFGNQFDAEFDAAVTGNQLLQLAGIADTQASAQEQIIAQLKSSQVFAVRSNEMLIARLTENRDEQKLELERQFNLDIMSLEAQITAAEQQLNAVRGISDNDLTIEQATRQFQEALETERQVRQDDRQQELVTKLDEVRDAIISGNAEQASLNGDIANNTQSSAIAAQDTLRISRQV